MKMSSPDTSVKRSRPHPGRRLVVLLTMLILAWSLPRPEQQIVVVDSADGSPRAWLAFRIAQRLDEFVGKGPLGDETELSGPAFSDDDHTLYFSRARPGQRANIVRSTWNGERWSRPEPVRELNSVDDDRRPTLSVDGRTAALASNRSGGHGGFDIYEAQWEDGHWSSPRNAGSAINSEANEFDPALSPDGLTLYFVRMVPNGDSEIYVSRRETLESDWSLPQPIEVINLAGSHERSPTVSPDGRVLIFASNRGDKVGETNAFGLFRAPLQSDAVGPVERINEGIGSNSDDIDAAFSASGQTLVFASKRDGPKQLYLSQGDFVVTRLTLSTRHLERFGRVKWGVPIAAALLCGIAYRWSRRSRAAGGTETKSISDAAMTLRRSEPTKNPLANWMVAAPDEERQTRTAKLASPTVRAGTNPSTSLPPIRPLTQYRWRRPSAVVAALVVLVTGLALLLRSSLWESMTTSRDKELTAENCWFDNLPFAEPTPSTPADLAAVVHADTSRVEAPQTIPSPSNAIALRPAARWPSDRTIVRQRFEVPRAATLDPGPSTTTRSTAMTRRLMPGLLVRLAEAPASEATLRAAPLSVEKSLAVAPITTVRQPLATPSAELLVRRPALPQAIFRPSASPAVPSVSVSPPEVAITLRTNVSLLLSRRRTVEGVGALSNCPPSEASLAFLTAPVDLSVTPQETRLLPTERVLAPEPTQPSRTTLLTFPQLTRNSFAVVTLPFGLVTATHVAGLIPSKAQASIKLVPLTEEVASPGTNAAPLDVVASSPDVKLTRRVIDGPEVLSAATPLASVLASSMELAALRAPASHVGLAADRDVAMTSNVPLETSRFARPRSSRERAELSAVEIAADAAEKPPITLASASVLADSPNTSMLTSLPRIELLGPTLLLESQLLRRPLVGLIAARVTLDVKASKNEPVASLPKPTLARHTRVPGPIELPENP